MDPFYVERHSPPLKVAIFFLSGCDHRKNCKANLTASLLMQCSNLSNVTLCRPRTKFEYHVYSITRSLYHCEVC
jgi:hypothetical protein